MTRGIPLRFLSLLVACAGFTGVAGAQFLADLKPTALRYTATVIAGAKISLSSTIKNVGAWPSGSAPSAFYLSRDAKVGSGDIRLSEWTTPGLGIGKSHSVTRTVTIPSYVAPGTCYIIVFADSRNRLGELSEGNNQLAGRASCVGYPDLTISKLTLTPAKWARGELVRVTGAVYNAGGVTAATPRLGIYLSKDSQISPGADTQLHMLTLGTIASRGTAPFDTSVRMPASAPLGTCYIGVYADPSRLISELYETNNSSSVPGTCFLRGGFTKFGTGCQGTGGVLAHGATASNGDPYVGTTATYTLTGGPKNWISLMWLGFSNTQWGAFNLPLALDAIGAKGCSLYVPPTLQFTAGTDANGTARVPLPLPGDAQLIGLVYFTQFVGLERSVNPLGLTFSNGLRTLVGSTR